ncbi:CotH kinase family protein [Clostridium tunisiense]|uniref:CotH kinase family protein n=1 Tax=Clostridium tunisiense TaxID=219748 RepID=UPI0002F0D9BD|nr:CotH kinase family protein [Clostridium tunisiense]
MKSKLIYTITMVFIIGICVGLYQLNGESKSIRVHQHREKQWQATNDEKSEEFKTHLPIVNINTGGQKVPGTPIVENGETVGYETAADELPRITASFSVIDQQKGANNITDKPTLSSLAEISYRGNSSRFFDKKSYSIHLVLEDGTENKKGIAGMEPHDEWVLNGPFLDRTLMRNYVALNISGEIMDYAPNVRYCEVFLDGKYQGLYLLMESVSRGEGRINIKKPDKNSTITSYIVLWDREGKGNEELDNYAHYTYRSGISALDVRYPGLTQITEERKEYIRKDISKIEKVLYSYDLTDEKKGYTQYIDLNSFAEYFVINEFFRNVDAGHYSTFYYKDVRGKLKPCVWDFNNGGDNYMENAWNEAGFTMINSPLFNALIKDEKFVTAVIKRYKELRKETLSEAYLLSYIDETNQWLGSSVDRNYKVWGYVFDLSNYNHMNYLTPVERNYTSYEQSVKQLKDFLVARGNWLDEHINTLYQYSHESKNINDLVK